MNANSLGINHQGVSPYESIMCKDSFAKSLIPRRHGGGGGRYIILIQYIVLCHWFCENHILSPCWSNGYM
jgi:hypothetical protein